MCMDSTGDDAYSYAVSAVEKGALAVVSYKDMKLGVPVIVSRDMEITMAKLSRRFYFKKEKKFKLIGVTGTNGKTTVTHLIKDILETCGESVGIIGTNGIFLKGKKTGLYKSTPTTPNSLELWQIFAAMQEENVENVVMEVSSHALSQKRVYGCEFDVGVFTNLSRDHLDFHKTLDEYKKAKEELFYISKKAVINIDDEAGRWIYSKIKSEKMSLGFSDADLWASATKMKENGSEFILEYMDKKVWVDLSLPGRFNIYNALSAAGACVFLGKTLDEISKGLKNAKPVRGRMENITPGKDFSVIIDYAHTPDGLEKIIHTAKGFSKGRVITLFGCGGDRDKTKRPIMGEISGRYSDITIITSDNPRTEKPMEIIGDIYEGIKRTKGKFLIVPDRRMAIEHAIDIVRAGDVILLAGKGQEEYQIIGKEKLHFDEREIVEECIKKKG